MSHPPGEVQHSTSVAQVLAKNDLLPLSLVYFHRQYLHDY